VTIETLTEMIASAEAEVSYRTKNRIPPATLHRGRTLYDLEAYIDTAVRQLAKVRAAKAKETADRIAENADAVRAQATARVEAEAKAKAAAAALTERNAYEQDAVDDSTPWSTAP